GPRPGVARPPHPLAPRLRPPHGALRSEEHTSELQSRPHLVCRLLLETKKSTRTVSTTEPPASLPSTRLLPPGRAWARAFLPRLPRTPRIRPGYASIRVCFFLMFRVPPRPTPFPSAPLSR